MTSVPDPGAESASGVSAPDSTRPIPLSIVLLVVLGVNTLGLSRGIATHDVLVHEIPGFTPTIFALWTAAQAAAVIGALALWLRFRFGLWLLAAAWACSAFVDVRLGATGHVILVTAVFGLVMLFVRPWQAALR